MFLLLVRDACVCWGCLCVCQRLPFGDVIRCPVCGAFSSCVCLCQFAFGLCCNYLHRPGNCLKVAYYSVKLYCKNLFLAISRTVLGCRVDLANVHELVAHISKEECAFIFAFHISKVPAPLHSY
jgi:hypothetical protein